MKVEEIKLAFNTNIQFAISDDLKGSVDSLNAINAEMNKSISNYDASYKAMQASASKAKSALASQGKLTGLAESKAKELGVPASSIPGYADATKAWGVVNSTVDKINEF